MIKKVKKVSKPYTFDYYPVKTQCLHYCNEPRREYCWRHKNLECELMLKRKLILDKFPEINFGNCKIKIIDSCIDENRIKYQISKIFDKINSVPFVYAENLLFTNEVFFDVDRYDRYHYLSGYLSGIALLNFKGNFKIDESNGNILIKYNLGYRCELKRCNWLSINLYITLNLAKDGTVVDYEYLMVFKPYAKRNYYDYFNMLSSSISEFQSSIPSIIKDERINDIILGLDSKCPPTSQTYIEFLPSVRERIIKEKRKIYDGRREKTLILSHGKYISVEEITEMNKR